MQQKHCRHVSSSHFSSSHFGSSHFGSSHFFLSHWTKSGGVLLQNKLLDQKWWSVAPEQPFVRPGVRLGAPKKHEIVTKTIWYTIYGEILFQKVASGYLLHFVQDGSSQNVLEKIVVAHKSKKWKKQKLSIPPSLPLEGPYLPLRKALMGTVHVGLPNTHRGRPPCHVIWELKKNCKPGRLHFWGSDPTLTHPKPPQSTSRET